MPRPPDAGFFGRDETLLAVDRAFDTGQVVLLHAYAGSWEDLNRGGVRPLVCRHRRPVPPPAWRRAGAVVLLRAPPALGPAPRRRWRYLLPAVGGQRHPLAGGSLDPGQRRDLVLQLLAQVQVLWIWDNTEPVTGFPPGTPSAWTQEEQDRIDACSARPGPADHNARYWSTSRRDERDLAGSTCRPGGCCRRCQQGPARN